MAMKDPEFETRLLHALEVLCEKITALNVTMTDLAQKLVPKVDEPAKVEPQPWRCICGSFGPKSDKWENICSACNFKAHGQKALHGEK